MRKCTCECKCSKRTLLDNYALLSPFVTIRNVPMYCFSVNRAVALVLCTFWNQECALARRLSVQMLKNVLSLPDDPTIIAMNLQFAVRTWMTIYATILIAQPSSCFANVPPEQPATFRSATVRSTTFLFTTFRAHRAQRGPPREARERHKVDKS